MGTKLCCESPAPHPLGDARGSQFYKIVAKMFDNLTQQI
jgi:hypothetical protein